MLESSPKAIATVKLMKAARKKLRITPGPAISRAAADPNKRPVPIDPPTATIVIWPAPSWCRSPRSWSSVSATGIRQLYQKLLWCQRDILSDLRNPGWSLVRCRCRNWLLKSHLGYSAHYLYPSSLMADPTKRMDRAEIARRVERAEKLLQKGKTAERNFLRLAEISSQVGDKQCAAAAFLKLAEMTGASGGNASQWFERAYTEDPSDIQIAIGYGKSLLAQGQIGAAIFVLEPLAKE